MRPATLARLLGYFLGYALVVVIEGAVAELEMRERLVAEAEEELVRFARLTAELADAEDQADEPSSPAGDDGSRSTGIELGTRNRWWRRSC